jgi:hypothetical protein
MGVLHLRPSHIPLVMLISEAFCLPLSNQTFQRFLSVNIQKVLTVDVVPNQESGVCEKDFTCTKTEILHIFLSCEMDMTKEAGQHIQCLFST